MSPAASPSWYDLLGVDPGAGADEVRAAWKAAIADLDPTDRRFAVYSRAAEVLLDPQRRAAYDAELAAAEPEDEDGLEPGTESESRLGPVAVPARVDHDGPEPADDLPVRPTATEEQPSDARAGRTVPAWLLAALAVLTAGVLVAVGVIWVKVPSDAAVEQSTRDAEAAAERAVGPILSYDYQHLDEDQQAADSYLTPDYGKKYDDLFQVVRQNATRTKTVVKAQVIASSIVRSGTDRVEVFLFVDQATTNVKDKTPVVYKNQVRAQMQQVGGQWLVDCLITTPNGHCD